MLGGEGKGSCSCCFFAFPLDVVDRDLLGGASIGTLGLALAITVVVELEAAVAVVVGAKGICLVDLGCVGQLAVRFPMGRGLVNGFFFKKKRKKMRERTMNGPHPPSTSG